MPDPEVAASETASAAISISAPAPGLKPTQPAPEATPSQGGAEMSVIDHLAEMRLRLFISSGAVLVAAIAVFFFNKPLIQILEVPLRTNTGPFGSAMPEAVLIFTTPGEYFFAVIKIALLGGLYLAMPVVLQQLLAFISPGLLPDEKRWAIPTVMGSFLFFTVGGIFAYYLLLPPALQFLVGFAPTEVKPMLSVGKYLGFAAGIMFATGLAFELPLFLLAAAAMGVVTSYSLVKQRRYAFFVAFVLAAILTPSVDVFTQAILAIALYMLFEISIIMIRLTGK